MPRAPTRALQRPTQNRFSTQVAARAAKKLGEEAVEVVIAAMEGDTQALTRESADLLYHLLVVLHQNGISLAMFTPSSNIAPAGPATRKKPRARPDHAASRGLNGRIARHPLRQHSRPTIVSRGDEWAALRADTPLTLSMEDLTRLRSLNDPISLEEVVAIYLPLSRLLALYVAATQGLYKATQRFLGAEGGKVPYIIGVAGSVAAGKSTLSRVMQALLSRWPNTPKVELITTDGFLYPNAVLESEGLLDKKGFPESYDGNKLLSFRFRC